MNDSLDELYNKYKLFGYITKEDIDKIKKIYKEKTENSNLFNYIQNNT